MTTHLVNIVVGEGGGILDGLYIERKEKSSPKAALVVSGVQVIHGGDNSPF